MVVGNCKLRLRNGNYAEAKNLRRMIGKDQVPTGAYKVTYKIDPSGSFIVRMITDENIDIRHMKERTRGEWTPAVGLFPKGGNRLGSLSQFVCWIPRSWYGLRVSRKVTPIRGKKCP